MHSTAILFLHGINDTGEGRQWLEPLNAQLEALGRPDLEAARVKIVVPDYSALLEAPEPPPAEMPDLTSHPDAGQRNTDRLNYMARQAKLWRELQNSGADLPMPDETRGPWAPTITPADAVAYKLKILKQVDRYRKNEGVRASILDKVIATIQGHDRWVIIGHSLGSVVALDLVTHLPDYVQVAALVTAASPLSRPKLSDHLKRQHSWFPHDRVGFWVNAYNAWDVVPGGTGISDAFPEAIDVVVRGRLRDHSAALCLTEPIVAAGIGTAVFGAQSREVSQRPTPLELAWSNVELLEAAALQLGFRTAQFLDAKNDQTLLERYETAREINAGQFTESIANGRRSNIQDPLQDLSSEVRGRIRASDVPSFLIALMSLNPVSPFQIEVGADVKRDARAATVQDFGIPPAHAMKARDAYEAARKSYKPLTRRIADGIPTAVWPVVAVAGVGAIVVAPFLVVAAAPAGLAGAAAITAGLASLGPGGMMGGLFVVGAMAGVGGLGATVGTIAPSLAASSPDQIQQACIELMARAKLTEKMNFDDTPGVIEWRLLSAVLATTSMELARLLPVCDDRAQVVRSAKRKVEIVKHALNWLGEQGLGPDSIRDVAGT